MEKNREGRTSISIVYDSLYARQEEQESYLTYDQASSILRSTPGIIFEPGTDLEDILNKLADYKLVCLDEPKKRIFVLSTESHSQSSPKYKHKRLTLPALTGQEQKDIEKTLESLKRPINQSMLNRPMDV